MMIITNQLFNVFQDNVYYLPVAVTTIGLSFFIYIKYSETICARRVDEINSTRVQEGLPNDVTITPEDIKNNPELAEVFDISDVNANVNIILESNEQFEVVQNQYVAFEFPTLIDIFNTIGTVVSAFLDYLF